MSIIIEYTQTQYSQMIEINMQSNKCLKWLKQENIWPFSKIKIEKIVKNVDSKQAVYFFTIYLYFICTLCTHMFEYSIRITLGNSIFKIIVYDNWIYSNTIFSNDRNKHAFKMHSNTNCVSKWYLNVGSKRPHFFSHTLLFEEV